MFFRTIPQWRFRADLLLRQLKDEHHTPHCSAHGGFEPSFANYRPTLLKKQDAEATDHLRRAHLGAREHAELLDQYRKAG